MDAEALIGSLIRGTLTGRKKRSHGALRYLAGGGNSFLSASTLLTVAGLAWGVLESAGGRTTVAETGGQWGGGTQGGGRFEDLEDIVVADPQPGILPTIYNLKRDMLFLRKSVWPLREAISKMQRTDSPLVSEAIKIYLRDVYDHTIQVIENIETFRDMSVSLLETYLSSLSNKLNEVIKLLTIISTIFIPLTFLAGVYGMNFRFMPELESPWGYPAVLIFMLLVVLVVLAYFHRKEWI